MGFSHFLQLKDWVKVLARAADGFQTHLLSAKELR
jgi:hypothetical protein